MRRVLAPLFVLGAIASCEESRRPHDPYPRGMILIPPDGADDDGADAFVPIVDAAAFSLEVLPAAPARCGERATLAVRLRNDDIADTPFRASFGMAYGFTIPGAEAGVLHGTAPSRSVTEIPLAITPDRVGRGSSHLSVYFGAPSPRASSVSTQVFVDAQGTYLHTYPERVDFGDIGPGQVAATIPIYFMNFGNEALQLDGLDGVPPDVEVDGVFPQTLEPVADNAPRNGSATLRMRSGAPGTAFTGTVTPRLAATTTHCGPIKPITVQGTRVAADSLTITPRTLSYPPRPCAPATSLEGEIRIGNPTAATLTFAAFPGKAGVFEARNRSGLIAPGASESLVITASNVGGVAQTAIFEVDLRSVEPPLVHPLRTAELWSRVVGPCPEK